MTGPGEFFGGAKPYSSESSSGSKSPGEGASDVASSSGQIREIFATVTPEEVSSLHQFADTDLFSFSGHHTVGRQPSQASPGNHNHDGSTSDQITLDSISDLSTLTINPSQVVGLFDPSANSIAEYAWDFFGATIGTEVLDSPFSIFAVGATAATTSIPPIDANHPGILQSNTGTTATGHAGIFTNPSLLVLGGGEAICEWTVRFPLQASAGEDFNFRCGFFDNSTGDALEGVYFEYDRSVGGNFWRIATSDNSVRTKATTIVGVAANTWYRLKCVVDAAGASAEFFIDGISQGSLVTTIPITVARPTAIGANIIKTAGVGQRVFLADKCYYKQTFSAPR